jgi:hypothetical protein
VPSLTVASLIGIRPLCKAGCTVVFDDKKCDVIFDGNVILRGFKDPSTDLWTLPIGKNVRTSPGPNILSRPGPCSGRAPHVNYPSASATPAVTVATFTHSVQTRANAIKFAHQSLCSPKISTLLKAVRRGFLKGCPNMTEQLILKYLNPSAAMANGHMKRPRHGLRSTHTRPPVNPAVAPIQLEPVPVILPLDIAADITNSLRVLTSLPMTRTTPSPTSSALERLQTDRVVLYTTI